jgi:hypothetical protein
MFGVDISTLFRSKIALLSGLTVIDVTSRNILSVFTRLDLKSGEDTSYVEVQPIHN